MSQRNPFAVRLEPTDEWMHENTGESNYNESMYFNFFDASQRRAGQTTRISEGMTAWSWEGRTGYGLSEYLDPIE